MAKRDLASLKEQDKAFARRLGQKDQQVLFEIDRAYAPALRRHLEKSLGPWFQDADIEEVLNEALYETGEKYRPDGGGSVKTFYFMVAHSHRNKILARNKKRLDLQEEQVSSATEEKCVANDDPAVLYARAEGHRSRKVVMAAVEQELQSGILTERQRIAFQGRFMTSDDHHWAKKLEGETGIKAHQLRSASDVAFRKIRKRVITRIASECEKGGLSDDVESRDSA